MVKQYTAFFSSDEFTEALQDMPINIGKKNLILEQTTDLQGLSLYDFMLTIQDIPLATDNKDIILKQIKNIVSQRIEKEKEE